MIQVGLEILTSSNTYRFPGERLGYLSNQASTSSQLLHGRVLLQEKFGRQLTCLFSPQHGFFSEKQDNMIESQHCRDLTTGLTIYSLYGDHRRPTQEMFEELDVLLVDLADVGTRVYTYIYTVAYCMQVAAEMGKRIVILDRPNPIGGIATEGNLLQKELKSFVGLYPLPMRHGLTLGEFAGFINREYDIDVDLQVIRASGWKRSMYFRESGFPWVSPSPNMPSPEAALVYPGQVIWEGTNVSEGRGTTQPFEFVGAPFWHHAEMLEMLERTDLPGCVLRPVVFEPTSGKWEGCGCNGFQIHVQEREIFQPYRTSLAMLQASLLLYPEQFSYKQPPYEYEYKTLPMDLIIGDKQVRQQLETGMSIMELERSWQEDLEQFKALREKYLLY